MLHIVQAGIYAVCPHQFVVSAYLFDGSVFDDNNLVGMSNRGPDLLKYQRQNGNRNVNLIQKRVDGNYLRQLAKSRHYDVVLALSVIHHFKDYPEVIDALFRLGDCLFIEPPAIEEKKNSPSARSLIVGIYEHLLPKAPYILTYARKTDKPGSGAVPLRPLFVFDRRRRATLTRSHFRFR